MPKTKKPLYFDKNGVRFGRGNKKWKDVYYVKLYQQALLGHTDKRIAEKLGVSHMALIKWKKQDPAVRHALREARLKLIEPENVTFKDYVYARLPERLQKLWDKIHKLEKANKPHKVRLILDNKTSKRSRQHLWIHAYVHYNFNKTAACRAVHVPNDTLTAWKRDPQFVELIAAMEDAKRDLFEESLVQLVRSGDPSAVIFANKTMNAKRGYSQPKEINHTVKGNVSVSHNGNVTNTVNLEDLDLGFDMLLAFQKAIKNRNQLNESGQEGKTEAPFPQLTHEVEDAEYTEVPVQEKEEKRLPKNKKD